MNTVFPVGEPLGPHYEEWRSFVRDTPDLSIIQLMRTITPQLMDAEAAAYDAPFPDRSLAGVRMFPEIAMVEPYSEGVAEARAANDRTPKGAMPEVRIAQPGVALREALTLR